MQRRLRRPAGARGSVARAAIVVALATVFACEDASVPGPNERPEAPAISGPVVLIVVDTLRADHLGLLGHDRPTSPRLDAWARSGHVFERAFAPSPWTLPSMGSLLTGRWPAAHAAGVMIERAPRRRFGVLASRRRGIVSLAEHLAAAGLRTSAVVSNPYLGPQFGLDRGFDEYDAARLVDERMRRADAGVDAALGVLERQPDARFFLMLHLYDPHLRYDAPAPERGRFTKEVEGASLALPIEDVEALRTAAATLTPEDRRFVAAAYDEEIAFVDRQLERVRQALAARGWLEAAWIVLTSDHGEELFDHGGFEHGHALWQALLHVPLIVWGPGVEPGRSAAPVSLVDVAPTLLDALRLPADATADGVSLLPLLRGGTAPPPRTLLAEGMYYGGERKAIVRWPHKLVFNPRNGLRRLVDLERDPAEAKALGEAARATADDLQRELEAHIRRHAKPSSEAELDDELRRQLEALGYAQ